MSCRRESGNPCSLPATAPPRAARFPSFILPHPLLLRLLYRRRRHFEIDCKSANLGGLANIISVFSCLTDVLYTSLCGGGSSKTGRLTVGSRRLPLPHPPCAVPPKARAPIYERQICTSAYINPSGNAPKLRAGQEALPAQQHHLHHHHYELHCTNAVCPGPILRLPWQPQYLLVSDHSLRSRWAGICRATLRTNRWLVKKGKRTELHIRVSCRAVFLFFTFSVLLYNYGGGHIYIRRMLCKRIKWTKPSPACSFLSPFLYSRTIDIHDDDHHEGFDLTSGHSLGDVLQT